MKLAVHSPPPWVFVTTPGWMVACPFGAHAGIPADAVPGTSTPTDTVAATAADAIAAVRTRRRWLFTTRWRIGLSPRLGRKCCEGTQRARLRSVATQCGVAGKAGPPATSARPAAGE